MTSEKIIKYIVTADHPVTSDEIRDKFVIIETTTGNYNTRRVIKEAIREYAVGAGLPIGANGNGYFLIKTQKEMDAYRRNLIGRIDGIRERISLVTGAWEIRSNQKEIEV